MAKKKTPKPGQFVYGAHPVLELLKAKRRRIRTIYTTKPVPKAFKIIERHLPKRPIQIQYVSRDILNNMVGSTEHQSIIALAEPFPYRKKFFDPKKEPFIVMLDEIQDVRNLGAILRSCYCTGVDGVIITKRGGAPITSATIKASAGLAEHVPVYIAPSGPAGVQELQKAGYNIYMAAFKGEDATQVSYQKPLCIVIGSESKGINPALLKKGTVITLPQRSSDISYNASVAAGILLFLAANKTKSL